MEGSLGWALLAALVGVGLSSVLIGVLWAAYLVERQAEKDRRRGPYEIYDGPYEDDDYDERVG